MIIYKSYFDEEEQGTVYRSLPTGKEAKSSFYKLPRDVSGMAIPFVDSDDDIVLDASTGNALFTNPNIIVQKGAEKDAYYHGRRTTNQRAREETATCERYY